jgi:hypothetical protein
MADSLTHNEKEARGMNGRFHNFATFCSYVYLLRMPVLTGLILVALPPIALWGPPKPLLENMFVLTPWNIFWAMIPALMLAWSLVVVSRVVLLNGKERFGIDQWMTQDTLRGSHLFWGSLPMLSLFACACVEKVRDVTWVPWWKWLGAAFCGALIAYVAGFGGLVLSIALAPHYKNPADKRFDIPFPFSKRILRWADGFRLTRPGWLPQWNLNRLPPDLRCGYVDFEGHLYPGQWLVLMLLLMSAIVYDAVGLYKGARLGVSSNVPAIAYVLVLMLVLNWVFSIVAFFLDRYRVPLVVPIALFCTLGGQFSLSDHYFALHDGIQVQPVSPSETLAVRAPKFPQPRRKNGGVVVVASAGGGIQAAAWTARVLTGLQEQCPAATGRTFADSIAVISAVSGGAVGTMFFVNQYESGGTTPGFHAGPADLQRIIEQTEASALSDIAWAIVYVDPFRIFLPYVRISEEQKTRDRGFALEQTWLNQGPVKAFLSEWRDGVTRGSRPGIIFNSTLAETGQPFLLSTTDFDTGDKKPTRQTFTEAYPKQDILVVTAARLAASFPYVSPATRALTNKREYHVVDGGYYDNFGIGSLVSWLDQALDKINKDQRPDVLVIQIRSFPTDFISDPTSKGWFYQSYAPVDALLSVRTTAQLIRGRDELNLLEKKWAADDVHFKFATFEFSGKDAPLSWQLTKRQRDTIEAEWQSILSQGDKNNDLQSVRSFCNPQQGEMPAAATAPR